VPIPCRWLALILIVCSGGLVEAATELQWPLSLQPALSSTFAETRSTALHFGIDLKTWGKTGFEVRAVADGSVMRLRTSPWGYGRAIYLRLDDGRIVVYAHLGSMAEPMAVRVRAAQLETGRYTTDSWLEGDEIPIRRGELIATTGDTGAGYPHLHLELRSADNVPLNLLTNGLSVPDKTAPTIQRVALVPLDINSTVNGGHAPLAMTAGWKQQHGHFEVAEPVVVHGRIGVSIKSYDRADAAQNKMAPYRHQLLVDGTPVLTATYDRVSLADVHQVSLDRLRIKSADGAGWEKGFFSLFRRSGNRLEFYEATGSGVLEYQSAQTGGALNGHLIDKGEHVVEITCADVAGNQSRVRLTLRANASPRIHSIRLIESGNGGEFIEANLSDADDERLHVALSRSADGEGNWEREWVQKIRAGAGPFTWELPPSKDRHWKLSVTDAAGSGDMRTFATGPEPVEHAEVGSALSLTRSVYAEFVDVMIRSPRPLDEPPQILVNPRSSEPATLELRQTDPTQYIATLPLPNKAMPGEPGSSPPVITVSVAAVSGGRKLQAATVLSGIRVEPGKAVRVPFAAGEVQLSFDEGSLYEAFYPQAEGVADPKPSGLVATGIDYDIGPGTTSFDRPILISLRKPANLDAEKLAVYVESAKGKWVFAGNERDAENDDYIGARSRQLGRFGLLLDDTPPGIYSLRPKSGSTVESRRPLLSAAIADSGSGISREDQVALFLDGRQLISIYDPDANLVTFEPLEDLSAGEHELVVIVRDNCTNETRKQSVFRIR